jgi:hypothetical protein
MPEARTVALHHGTAHGDPQKVLHMSSQGSTSRQDDPHSAPQPLLELVKKTKGTAECRKRGQDREGEDRVHGTEACFTPLVGTPQPTQLEKARSFLLETIILGWNCVEMIVEQGSG